VKGGHLRFCKSREPDIIGIAGERMAGNPVEYLLSRIEEKPLRGLDDFGQSRPRKLGSSVGVFRPKRIRKNEPLNLRVSVRTLGELAPEKPRVKKPKKPNNTKSRNESLAHPIPGRREDQIVETNTDHKEQNKPQCPAISRSNSVPSVPMGTREQFVNRPTKTDLDFVAHGGTRYSRLNFESGAFLNQ